MTSKRTTTFAMTNNERVAHRRELRRIRQKRWRDKRKDAVGLVPPENLPLYTGHRLGQFVHSFSEEKAKARKRRTKQYKKILKNPRLLAEEKHKASWRGRVHRAYRGVFKRWKKKESDQHRILLGAKTLRKQLESKLDRGTPEFKKCKTWRTDFYFTHFYDRIVADFDLV